MGTTSRLFWVILVRRMSVLVPSEPWDCQPVDCVIVYNHAPFHTALLDSFLDGNEVHRLQLPPFSPEFSAVERVFNDCKHAVRTLAYRHLHLPDRILHVLADAYLSDESIQEHRREARKHVLRNLPEMTR